MNEFDYICRLLEFADREFAHKSPPYNSTLDWCVANAAACGVTAEHPDQESAKKGKSKKKKFNSLLDFVEALAQANKVKARPPSELLRAAQRLGRVLGLPDEEISLLQTLVALQRIRRVSAIRSRLSFWGVDTIGLAAEISGIGAAENVKHSQLHHLRLIKFSATGQGNSVVELVWAALRVVEQMPETDERLIELLVGQRQSSGLRMLDFAHLSPSRDLLCRLLKGSLKKGSKGTNILIYGPPGTGKTEFARTLSESVGAHLHGVGETDEDGEEPNRWDRVTALKLAQRVLANRNDTVLLFDELQDMVGGSSWSSNGRFFEHRDGSKIFMNRMFESNPVPTIWTSNSVENVDPALLRRMSFVLKTDYPPSSVRRRIMRRIAKTEGLRLSAATIERLAEESREATTVARTAMRTARMAESNEEETLHIVSMLTEGVRHGAKVRRFRKPPTSLNLDLYQSKVSISSLIKRLSGKGAPNDFSMLLSGPPGTGKTALAHYLAQRLDRPLLVLRASDLLSKWIGETERNIASAFGDAEQNGSLLLIDEVDSLLLDRSLAVRSWEITQINELLTSMEDHPLPFIATTNQLTKLDPAAMRRFDFKLALEPLSAAQADVAFEAYFEQAAPAELRQVRGLTPGDFANVARQLRFHPKPCRASSIVQLLSAETQAKPTQLMQIGFAPSSRKNTN